MDIELANLIMWAMVTVFIAFWLAIGGALLLRWLLDNTPDFKKSKSYGEPDEHETMHD